MIEYQVIFQVFTESGGPRGGYLDYVRETIMAESDESLIPTVRAMMIDLTRETGLTGPFKARAEIWSPPCREFDILPLPKTYFTLLVRDGGIWSPEFGDYSRSVVESEKRDYHDSQFDSVFLCDLKIISTDSDTQAAIDSVVSDLNKESK